MTSVTQLTGSTPAEQNREGPVSSHFPRTVRDGKSLPQETVQAPTHHTFITRAWSLHILTTFFCHPQQCLLKLFFSLFLGLPAVFLSSSAIPPSAPPPPKKKKEASSALPIDVECITVEEEAWTRRNSNYKPVQPDLCQSYLGHSQF